MFQDISWATFSFYLHLLLVVEMVESKGKFKGLLILSPLIVWLFAVKLIILDKQVRINFPKLILLRTPPPCFKSIHAWIDLNISLFEFWGIMLYCFMMQKKKTHPHQSDEVSYLLTNNCLISGEFWTKF